MKLILSIVFTLIVLNISAQTKEDKWKSYVTTFQNALTKKDKKTLISLVAPTLDGEGITNAEWVSRILSNNAELSKIKKTLLAKSENGIGHEKMKCHEALCLYFDYKKDKWLLVDAFED
jgi:c-di-AMP phosphodiesterase-like protein